MRFTLPLLLALPAVLGCPDEELVVLPDEPAPAPEGEEVDVPPREEDPNIPPVTSGDECANDSDCGANAECESGVCVGVGVLQITLTFQVDADYDLHVITPSGNEIYWLVPEAAGGVLDVDQCIESCGNGTHVENIFFDGTMEAGLYIAWVENFDGRDGGPFRIDVSGKANTSLEGFLPAISRHVSEELAFAIED